MLDSGGFQDPTAALAAGYSLLTDAQDIACIDMPGMAAMGMHYVNGTLRFTRVLFTARVEMNTDGVMLSSR